MESSSLVAIPGSRLPEMLGNFHLDNHHVEEWSDPSEAGSKHRARKEVGKWVNMEKSADIHYQKQEDSKKSDKGQERSRTEVIKGSAPDSTFQVVRSHRQFQGGDETSGSTMQQSSSTSYHVSSSRNVRSTTKTTSNKTTTKTVSVSGGSRADDFENLRMSFTPLDTSTQRERINVSRSGTMGIRRPPTRRHTPAALICSSPEDGPDILRPEDGQILVDSDDNLRDTPDPGKMSEQSGISIIGFKNISPKIRVGFPVEIQLELQTKLRSSSTLERNHHTNDVEDVTEENFADTKETDGPNSRAMNLMDQSTLPIPLCGLSSVSSRESSFDFRGRRKSFMSENFDLKSGENQQNTFGNLALRRSSLNQMGNNRDRDGNERTASNLQFNKTNSSTSFLSSNERLAGEMSWDLIQSMQQMRKKGTEQSSKIYSTMSSQSSASSGEDFVLAQLPDAINKLNDNATNEPVNNISSCATETKKGSFTQRLETINMGSNGNKTTIVTLNASPESLIEYGAKNKNYELIDSLERSHSEDEHHHDDDPKKISSFIHTDDFQYHDYPHIISTPDVLHHENSSSTSLSSLERSRKLLKMLDETPDLLNKMSFRSYFSNSEKPEIKDWEDEKDDMDWETQRQLSFLNDSLSRILDDTHRSIDKLGEKDKAVNELDFNGNLKEMGKMSQVSQTWISFVDHKPAQTVRDNDVVTSISATNDAYKKGPKKVEFSKTEVHFTPDSGRFNIVETDENKPSTTHLFRRKKRSEKKTSSSSSSSMSSLESTHDKNDTAYILEMQVETEKSRDGRSEEAGIFFGTNQHIDDSKLKKSENSNTGSVHIGRAEAYKSQWENTVHGTNTTNFINSLPQLTSNCSKSESDKHADTTTDRSQRVLVNLENIGHEEFEFEDDIRSPSHTILSNYGEMKIQRYLKQLKSPSSREGSTSPVGSPTLPDDDNEDDRHFRFDNILYENGSFVPLATRRSLIEMNNRNRKRLNATTSQSSDNSSTTSTYSLPNSDKEQYSTLRLDTLEATVATRGGQPQITSVDFRYTHGHPLSPELTESSQHNGIDYHSLSVKERRERFSLVPSPVMPHPNVRVPMRHSIAVSPTDSHASDFSSNRPTSSIFLTKKPPTPILPLQFSSFEKTGAELRERFYAKSNTNSLYAVSDTEAIDGSARPSTLREDLKFTGKSIVTIGSHNEMDEEMTVLTTSPTKHSEISEPLSPEPILSLDHTWNGPTHFEENNESDHERKTAASRSLTFPKSARAEPEWVSKAKSRETRVTDWSLIEKQQQQTLTRNTEPPWISEIRFRNKAIPNEELKSLPKISVVYPWQRDSAQKESSVERVEFTEQHNNSHIVSMVPEPAVTPLREDKRSSSSYDLYSGKSLAPIKSLKAVPEVTIPSRNKGKSLVEINSEPEHYISSPHKFQLQQNHSTLEQTRKGETVTKTTEKKSSSLRIATESNAVAKVESVLREIETYPKKSRKPLQASQANKETVKYALKSEEKYKTQPKPPKPPQRLTSLSTKGNPTIREPALMMTIPPFKEINRHHKERVSAGSTSNHSSSTLLKKSGSKRKPGSEESPSSSSVPVHHRHPTIQIAKLPMRTTKATVVEGKRLSGTSSKSKTKHHGENTKPKSDASTLNTSIDSSTSSHCRERGKKNRKPDDTGGIASSSYQSTGLKTSSRPPVSESESKKRRTAMGGGGKNDKRK